MLHKTVEAADLSLPKCFLVSPKNVTRLQAQIAPGGSHQCKLIRRMRIEWSPKHLSTDRCVSHPDDKVVHFHTGQSCNGKGGQTKYPGKFGGTRHMDLLPFQEEHSYTLTLVNDETLKLQCIRNRQLCRTTLHHVPLQHGVCGLDPVPFLLDLMVH